VPYMLVRLQVKYGKVDQFCKVMDDLVPIVEKAADMRLVGAYRTTIGRLFECWDLWEVPPGFQGMGPGMSTGDDRNRALFEELADCLESEELHLMEKLPYSP
jgi:hypothetical protein